MFKKNAYQFLQLPKYGLLLLAGCASLPKDEQTENLITPPSLEESISTRVNSGFFSTGNWPEQNWWESFKSKDLNALIEEALSYDPSIQSIEKRVEFAKQNAQMIRSDLFPLIFFDANETWEYLSRNGLYRTLNPQLPLKANLVDLTLSFQYEFDFWGKNRNLFQAALGETKAQEAEAAGVRLIVSTSVAQGYFALKTNLLRKQLYQELYDTREAIVDLQLLLKEKALLSELQPLLSEESLLESEKLLSAISEEIDTNKHTLNALLGTGPDSPLEIDGTPPQWLESLVIPENLSVDLLARRPDLIAQIWRVEALAHEVGAAKADFYPNVNLKAFIGLESVAYKLLFKGASKTAGLQPAIHLPIFTAGAIRANLRAKKALFDSAVFEYNQLLLKSAQEIADLLSFAQSLFSQAEDQQKILESVHKRYDLTQLRQQSGLDSLISQYRIQEELILKQLEAAGLLYNQYVAAIKLVKALGGGYQSEYTVPLKANPEAS